MVNYPVRVPRSDYRGSDPRKIEKRNDYNRDAAELEKVANEMIKEDGPGVYLYFQIANRAGMSLERVTEIMFGVDCGHNGFTVLRGANEGAPKALPDKEAGFDR